MDISEESIIIIYLGFQWDPAKIMYNTVTIQFDTIRYNITQCN